MRENDAVHWRNSQCLGEAAVFLKVGTLMLRVQCVRTGTKVGELQASLTFGFWRLGYLMKGPVLRLLSSVFITVIVGNQYI